METSPMTEHDEMLRVMVLLSPEGALLSAKGPDAEQFATAAAYATQLARLVGEGLGIDGFRELGCEFRRGRCLVYFDENGNTVGVRPRPEIAMSSIREILGFR
jgi:hypothetical protein